MLKPKILVILPQEFYIHGTFCNQSISAVIYTNYANHPNKDNINIIIEEGSNIPDDINVSIIGRSDNDRAWHQKLIKQIEIFQPDIIEMHLKFNFAIRLKKQFPHIKFIYYCHNLPIPKKGLLASLYRGWRYNKIDAIISVSNAVEEIFKRYHFINKDKLFVIHNSLDANMVKVDLAAKKKIIFCAARPIAEKGLHLFLEAMQDFLPANPEWRAVLAIADVDVSGSVNEYAEQIKNTKINNVDLCSLSRAEVLKCQSECAISVVPSIWPEPFGLTALEGHLCGNAVISSGTGGLREVSGDNALYMENLDAISILEHLQKLAGDEEYLRQMQIKRMAEIDRFSVKKTRAKKQQVRQYVIDGKK